MKVACPLAPGAAVRIDAGDNLLLGEICHCSRVDGEYMAGVELEHALFELTELAAIMNLVMGRGAPFSRFPVCS